MPDSASPLTSSERRRALGLGHVNAALWATGNALTTGPLVSYLARDLGAQGLAVGLVLAIPNLAGVLRLVAPALIYRAGTARRACLAASLASYLLIVGLPVIALAAPALSRSTAVAAMIALLFAHQLLEYLGTVALWSWWADLVPPAIRGRYFARRQRVQLAVTIPMLLASGYFADRLRAEFHDQPAALLWAYAIPTAVGAVALLASLIPLAMMPATRRYSKPKSAELLSIVAAPLVDRRFWRFLVFRSWFSLANGISQTVQNVILPKDVLGLGVGPLSVMRVSMQLGQMSASRSVGRASDRFGNRPVLVAAQVCVSLALVFYMLARPDSRWLLLGAWLLFSAYVAHNICMPNLVLKLAPEAEIPAYVATSDALGSVFHAVATVAGGAAFDWLRAGASDPSAEPYRSCLVILVVGLAMRSLAVVLAATIQEPGAWTWREVIAGRKTR